MASEKNEEELLLDFTDMEDSLNNIDSNKNIDEIRTELFTTEDKNADEERTTKPALTKERVINNQPMARSMNKKLCEAVMRDVECQYTKKGMVCNYAHSIDELSPDTCNHGKGCYRITFSERHGYDNKGRILCRLKHEGETFENYIWRIGYEKYDKIYIPKVDANKKVITSSPVAATSPSSTSSSERKRSCEEPRSSNRPYKKSKYLPKKDL